MQKRFFLKTGLFAALGGAILPLVNACKSANKTAPPILSPPLSASPAVAVMPPPTRRRSGVFTLPALGMELDALEPHMDRQTMEIHHGRHHNAYVTNLNDAVKGTVFADYELEDILARLSASDADRKIRNNGGGHWNHSFFWKSLAAAKNSGAPSGAFLLALNGQYESVDKFKTQFSDAAKGVFGSGWAWLSVGKDKKLFISATPNQDNPLMPGLVKQTGTPILGLDVWEHAYYLKYQNKRPDYISGFFNVVNWAEVARRYEQAMG